MAYNSYSPYQSSWHEPPPPPTRIIKSLQVFHTLIEIVHGDITTERVDAITNAANEDLWLGGGVAGSINSKAGPEVDMYCKEYRSVHGKVPVGEVMVTAAGRLPCTYVIHAVGPEYREGQPNEDMLKHTVMSIFAKAEELGIGSLAIPAISSGIYGFPPHECAFIMLTALGEHLQATPATCLRQVRLININNDTVDFFKVRFEMMRPQFESLSQHLFEASAPQST